MKVKVNTSPTTKVITNTPTTQVVSVGVQGPAGAFDIYSSEDFDMTNIENGSVLVYKSSTNKWTSTTMLDAQNMEGGEF